MNMVDRIMEQVPKGDHLDQKLFQHFSKLIKELKDKKELGFATKEELQALEEYERIWQVLEYDKVFEETSEE